MESRDIQKIATVMLLVAVGIGLALDFRDYRASHSKLKESRVEFSSFSLVKVSLSEEVDRLYKKFNGSVCVIAIPEDHTLFIGNSKISPAHDGKASDSQAPVYSEGCRYVIGDLTKNPESTTWMARP